MRVIFMGTPEFAVPVLAEIVQQGHEVVTVYTRAPKPGGRRGLETVPSPVHRFALDLDLTVFTPQSLRSESATAAFRVLEADVAVVVAYGLILPKAILDAPKYGCLNIHASLLPRWRGAAPIERAIMAGDAETGVAIMRMEEGLDTGPVALQERVAIGPDTTAGELRKRLSLIGARLMTQVLTTLPKGTLHFRSQSEEGISYAHKISKAEAQVDWSKKARDLHNLVRALAPRPGAVFAADLGKGTERIKVLRSQIAPGHGAPGFVLDDQLTVACGDQALRLLEVQRAGKAPMSAAEFLRGARLGTGTRLPPAA